MQQLVSDKAKGLLELFFWGELLALKLKSILKLKGQTSQEF